MPCREWLTQARYDGHGRSNRLLANDQAVITFTAEAQRPQAQEASDEIVKAGNAAIAALNAINAPAGQVEVQTRTFQLGR